ncbi:hypothetical protein C8Q72DRAFT_994726 [Fomitopsis betulina]|nr:hypothetical protein C8Q72DRAFT_994726 [Fomitopsis betulina]
MSAEFQHGFYIGNIFSSILYGFELVLYGMTMRILFQRKQWRTLYRSKKDVFFLAFSTLLLLCATTGLATNCLFGEEWWISHQNYPGGSEQWFADNAAVWYETWGTTASILAQLLADAFLIYRCLVLWNSFLLVSLPCLIWVGSLALGVMTLYYSGIPGGDNFAGLAQVATIACLACTMTINVSMTALIVGRILRFAYTTGKLLPQGSNRQYFGIVTIVIESALLNTVFGLMYLVSSAVGSDLSGLFMCFYTMFTAIAPQLIIVRVLSGSAWSRTTHDDILSHSMAVADRSFGVDVSGGSRTLNNVEHVALSETSLQGSSKRETKCLEAGV